MSHRSPRRRAFGPTTRTTRPSGGQVRLGVTSGRTPSDIFPFPFVTRESDCLTSPSTPQRERVPRACVSCSIESARCPCGGRSRRECDVAVAEVTATERERDVVFRWRVCGAARGSQGRNRWWCHEESLRDEELALSGHQLVVLAAGADGQPLPHTREKTVRGHAEQEAVRERRPRALLRPRRHRGVHRVEGRYGQLTRMRVRHVLLQAIGADGHQEPAPVADDGGLLGAARRQVRRHPEGKGAEAAAADAGKRVERAGRPRPQLAAPAVFAGAAHGSHVAAAATGDGRLGAAAAAAPHRHGEPAGAHRRAEPGDAGGHVAADGSRHGAPLHGQPAGEGRRGGEDAHGGGGGRPPARTVHARPVHLRLAHHQRDDQRRGDSRRRQASRGSRRVQPVHLPPAPGVHRHRPGVDVPALRPRDIRQGVYRQAHEHVQVFRVRVVRQRAVRSTGHLSHARLPNRDQKAEGAAQEGQGLLQALLAKETSQSTPSTQHRASAVQSQDLAAIFMNCEIFLLVNGGPWPLVN